MMNRGHGGEAIFRTDGLKSKYLALIGKASKNYGIPVYAYCLMENHFHLVVQNASGQLSRFMKTVHSSFASFYRCLNGGRGYVFQDRFKSTVIQGDSYLLKAILYVLNNPVRAGLVSAAVEYKWSSANEYFNKKGLQWLDCDLIQGIFVKKRAYLSALCASRDAKLHEVKNRFGAILGGEEFAKEAECRYDRRREPGLPRSGREEDKYFEPVKKVIWEYERKIGKPVEEIDLSSHQGRRQRAELLRLLKDLAGLTYREIKEIELFHGLAFSSLGSIYVNAVRNSTRRCV